jgi:hypothetical protein
VSERALDIVMDHLYTLNDETPKIKCEGKNGVDSNLIFGIESKLFLHPGELGATHDEVETVTVVKGASALEIDKDALIEALRILPRALIWRVKGFAKLSDGSWVSVNWAFGRHDIQEYNRVDIEGCLRMSIMGSHGSVRKAAARFTAIVTGGTPIRA